MFHVLIWYAEAASAGGGTPANAYHIHNRYEVAHIAIRQSNKRCAVARTRTARSVTLPDSAPKRIRGKNTQLLDVPATDGQTQPVDGREAAMTLLQAVHVVAHAVLRGAFSIRWTSPSSLPERGRAGE